MQVINPVVAPRIKPMPERAKNELRVGQLNTYNLFDTVDDPSTQDPTWDRAAYKHHLGKLAVAIRDAMGAPDVITIQEAENIKVLKDLVARPELKGLGYKPLLREGTDPRGIDTAILYRDTVKLLEVDQIDPVNVGENGRGTHLFTRPPLVARFGLDGRENAKGGLKELTVVATHFTSKLGQEKAAAKRELQAREVADFATGLQAVDPRAAVVIAGDFNMEYAEPEFAALRNTRRAGSLVNLTQEVPEGQRFSWRDGRKHLLLDHMLTTKDMAKRVTEVLIPHIGTRIEKGAKSDPVRAEGVSDHDPIVATFQL